MEWLVRLLVPIALAHPGHGEEAPICDPGPALSCPLPTVETSGRSELHLAKMLLARGMPAEAAQRVAVAAVHDAEAAALLAEALEALGDAAGAAIARERAGRLATGP